MPFPHDPETEAMWKYVAGTITAILGVVYIIKYYVLP